MYFGILLAIFLCNWQVDRIVSTYLESGLQRNACKNLQDDLKTSVLSGFDNLL